VQLPGQGPSQLYSMITAFNSSGVIVESNSSRIDGLGSAFLSSVPGFINVTIGPSNVDALAPNYASCQAPISFTNGLRQPTQPTTFNGAAQFSYSYFISDGATYSVQANLTITTSSAFATTKDMLGNPYQTIINVTGARTYSHLPTGEQLTSTVNGLSAAGKASQRFYPYSLLSSAPGVYTLNTAPFFDYDGVEFIVSPPIPLLGLPIGQGVLYNATSIYLASTYNTAVLTEGYSTNLPLVSLQQQQYAL